MQFSARSGHSETGNSFSPDGSRSSPSADRSEAPPRPRRPVPSPLPAGQPRRADGRCATFASEDAARRLRQAGKLAGAAGQDDAACPPHCRSLTCSAGPRSSSSVSSMRRARCASSPNVGSCSGTSPSSPIGWIETRVAVVGVPATPSHASPSAALRHQARSKAPWPYPA